MVDNKDPNAKSLRVRCFIIGYANLIACSTDFVFHFVVAAMLTRGFRCDVDQNSLNSVQWPWLDPLLVFIKMGTSGFYAFPLSIHTNGETMDFQGLQEEPRCYSGILHIYLVDILNFFINLAWLKFVVMFINGLRNKDLKPLRMFLHLSMANLILQIVYFAYQPAVEGSLPIQFFWIVKLIDVVIATTFIYTVNSYINALRNEDELEQPPPYVECHTEQHKAVEEQQQTQQATEALETAINNNSSSNNYNSSNNYDGLDNYYLTPAISEETIDIFMG